MCLSTETPPVFSWRGFSRVQIVAATLTGAPLSTAWSGLGVRCSARQSLTASAQEEGSPRRALLRILRVLFTLSADRAPHRHHETARHANIARRTATSSAAIRRPARCPCPAPKSHRAPARRLHRRARTAATGSSPSPALASTSAPPSASARRVRFQTHHFRRSQRRFRLRCWRLERNLRAADNHRRISSCCPEPLTSARAL